MHQLSPSTRAGLARMRELIEQPPQPKRRRRLDPVYLCPTCHDVHEHEEDAVDCCQPADAESDRLPRTCPVCLTEHTATDEAAHCCLWHDLNWLQRYLVARAVEAGSTWHDAIERQAAHDPVAPTGP